MYQLHVAFVCIFYCKLCELHVLTVMDVVYNFFISYMHKGFKYHGLEIIALLPNKFAFSNPTLCLSDHSFTRHKMWTVWGKENK